MNIFCSKLAYSLSGFGFFISAKWRKFSIFSYAKTIEVYTLCFSNRRSNRIHGLHWLPSWNMFHDDITFYYMEESVLLGAKPLVDSIRRFMQDPSGEFSVCHLCECRIVQWRHDSGLLLLFNIYSSYNKNNIARWREDRNFMFSWQEEYLAGSLRSLVRYYSCHSNIKFISPRHRVISSINRGARDLFTEIRRAS